jgi:hypothetical protein
LRRIVSHDSPAWNPSRQSFSNKRWSSVTAKPHSLSWYASSRRQVPHQHRGLPSPPTRPIGSVPWASCMAAIGSVRLGCEMSARIRRSRPHHLEAPGAGRRGGRRPTTRNGAENGDPPTCAASAMRNSQAQPWVSHHTLMPAERLLSNVARRTLLHQSASSDDAVRGNVANPPAGPSNIVSTQIERRAQHLNALPVERPRRVRRRCSVALARRRRRRPT